MAKARGHAKRGGSRGLEAKTHELEVTDRERERRRDARPSTGEEPEAAPELRPPDAHEE